MADKSFGVKQINLIGAAGTPTVESPGELFLNANIVSISTSIKVTGDSYFSNSVGIGTTSTVNTFQIGAGNSAFVVTGIGSVGIGTTNPTSKLHVIGDARIGIDNTQGVILTSSNGTKYRLVVSDAGVLSTVLVT